ncbi:MAG: F0F1 ATP synthase subunit B [Dehalococcoidia bacterium]
MEPLFLAGIVDGLKALGVNLPSLIAQIINFTLLLVILRVFAYKPVMRLLDERKRRIREGLEAAEESKRRLAQAEEEAKVQLEKARQEGQTLIGQAQQAAARLQEEGRQQARREAEQLLARARGEIRLERDGAIAQLRGEFADLTVRAAERVIRQSVDRRAHRRLIEEVLAEAPHAGDGGEGREKKS